MIETSNSNSMGVDHASEMTERIINSFDWQKIKLRLNGRCYDVIDFFSGCGGLSYGFHLIGKTTRLLKPVAAFDMDDHANKTFELNLGLIPEKIDIATMLANDKFNTFVNRDKSRPLIIMGGPPCQGFSAHRKKDKRKDKRNSLVGVFAEIATGLNPEIIVMENVPDLLAKKHWHHFQEFRDILESAGYKLTAGIVNMAGYGVPQKRHRVIIIAAKGIYPVLPAPFLQESEYKTVRDAIGYLPELSLNRLGDGDPMHIASRHRESTIDIIRHVPKDGGSRPFGIGPKCLDRVNGFYDVYGRLFWDRPSITITARCRTPSCGRYIHPEHDRGLSIREVALLQGYPSDYIFEGPFDDKYKQIGNSVPPIFSTYLAAHILSWLAGLKNSSLDELPAPDAPYFRSYSGSITLKNK
jgi:DNA (cytosine-5)-methyltransferase 1